MLLILTNIRYVLLAFLTAAVVAGCGFSPTASDSPTDSPESPPAAEVTESDTASPQPSSLSDSASASEPTASTPNAASITVQDALPPLTSEALWAQLKQPGDTFYAVLMRHALAPGTGDPANFQLEDCATQRNLSDEGRSQAEQIGQAFRDRGVAVQAVLSSQWCRCLETAELMGVGAVEPYPPLNSFFRDRSLADAQTTAVKQYLLSRAQSPGVTVMVTHQVNITDLTGIVPQSGEAVVLQVDETSLTQIGQFRPASSEG